MIYEEAMNIYVLEYTDEDGNFFMGAHETLQGAKDAVAKDNGDDAELEWKDWDQTSTAQTNDDSGYVIHYETLKP